MTNMVTRRVISKLCRNRDILRPFIGSLRRHGTSSETTTSASPGKPALSPESLKNEISESLELPKTYTEFYAELLKRKEEIASLDPLKFPDFFKVRDLFTIEDLFNAKVHYGHKEGSLDPNMQSYVYGTRLGHVILDLEQTAVHLQKALNFAAHIAYREGIILFIAKKPQIAYKVEKTAKECGEYAHTRNWEMGTFLNAKSVFGIATRLPDLCIFLNTMDTVNQQHMAVSHAAKMCIPSIGIVDSNCNPNIITYPVPGNDDTPCAIDLYCDLFKTAIQRGKAFRKIRNDMQNAIESA